MTEIRLEHVSYAYDDEKILEDINLQVTSGEVVSILGPSGVGKTTLFNLIGLLIPILTYLQILILIDLPKQIQTYLQMQILIDLLTLIGLLIPILTYLRIQKHLQVLTNSEIGLLKLTAYLDLLLKERSLYWKYYLEILL